MENLFPVLDISKLSEHAVGSEKEEQIDTSNQDVQSLIHQLSNGFETWGFLYLRGHGISEDLVNKAFRSSKEFFLQPNDIKVKFRRGEGINEGYVPPEGEVFDKSKSKDLKEAFDFRPNCELSRVLSEQFTEYMEACDELFSRCRAVFFKLLRLLALAMGMDPEHFVKMHRNVGNKQKNGSSLRLLYYPQLPREINADSKRCREHTDYGTVTFLFQDDVGGLEVQSPSGDFIKAVPIPGTIVINVGDILHSMSGGRFKATIHRVTTETAPGKGKKARQSIAFFTHPDYDVTYQHGNEDGSTESRNAFQFLKKRFDETIVVR